jgi:hypothetical protein
MNLLWRLFKAEVVTMKDCQWNKDFYSCEKGSGTMDTVWIIAGVIAIIFGITILLYIAAASWYRGL